MEAARPVMVVLQVVGAVPGQLDREADALGDRDRLGDRVRVEPAAVSLTGRPTRWEIATASATGSASSLRPKPPPMRVMFTWTFSGAVPSTFEASLRAPSGAFGVLGRCPNLGPVPLHVREAVLGLEIRVRDERIGVRGLDYPGRAGEGLVLLS